MLKSKYMDNNNICRPVTDKILCRLHNWAKVIGGNSGQIYSPLPELRISDLMYISRDFPSII